MAEAGKWSATSVAMAEAMVAMAEAGKWSATPEKFLWPSLFHEKNVTRRSVVTKGYAQHSVHTENDMS